MASLTIRNIPDDAKQRFRERAAAHGRSMEEEARQMILTAVAKLEEPARKSMFEMLYDASRPGFDLPIPPRSRARIPRLDEE